MKVLIAPDSFKESMAAAEVAAALAEGVLEACPDVRPDACRRGRRRPRAE